MTGLGHERRFRDVRGMSALPSRLTVTADILDWQLGAKRRHSSAIACLPHCIDFLTSLFAADSAEAEAAKEREGAFGRFKWAAAQSKRLGLEMHD